MPFPWLIHPMGGAGTGNIVASAASGGGAGHQVMVPGLIPVLMDSSTTTGQVMTIAPALVNQN